MLDNNISYDKDTTTERIECSYERCLSCPFIDCLTGQAARRNKSEYQEWSAILQNIYESELAMEE